MKCNEPDFTHYQTTKQVKIEQLLQVIQMNFLSKDHDAENLGDTIVTRIGTVIVNEIDNFPGLLQQQKREGLRD